MCIGILPQVNVQFTGVVFLEKKKIYSGKRTNYVRPTLLEMHRSVFLFTADKIHIDACMGYLTDSPFDILIINPNADYSINRLYVFIFSASDSVHYQFLSDLKQNRDHKTIGPCIFYGLKSGR